MVLQNRLGDGFVGYRVPPIPRAKRSARRGLIKKEVEDNSFSAFDLLATLAGKLLLEGGSSVASAFNTDDQRANVQDGGHEENKKDEDVLPKVEPCDQGSAKSSSLVKEGGLPCPRVVANACSGGPSSLATYGSSCTKTVQNSDGNERCSLPRKLEGCFLGYMESSLCQSKDHVKERKQCQPLSSGETSFHAPSDSCISRDPILMDVKPPTFISLNSSGNISYNKNHFECMPRSMCRDNVTIVGRDDDENFSWCTKPCTISKPSRSPAGVGDRKIRKYLASKFLRVIPGVKDGYHSDYGRDALSMYDNRKRFYRRQMFQGNYPLKKRKISYHSLVSSRDGMTPLRSAYQSQSKFDDNSSSGFEVDKHGDYGSTSSAVGQKASFLAGEHRVKLRIKSFLVPELYFEIPETATVASLKGTVMEAVNMLLGDGLRVGVLFQGKRIRDDNLTLLQTGVSHDKSAEALAFTLEPSTLQSIAPKTSESCAPAHQSSSKCPTTISTVDRGMLLGSASIPHNNLNLGVGTESDHDSAPSPSSTEISTEKSTINSRALVAIPEANVKPLAVVRTHHKSKRTEVQQRRIRRPFSVGEVEALVQAVEELGTGRWRDVKLRAFDNVKHRTYVDLKDKWKTLVHTAQISPQLRRGEPVPQVLLDRVLTAHAYWSQHQPKQQLKQQVQACHPFL